MLGFDNKHKNSVSQDDVYKLLTELKYVPLPEAQQRINILRKSATRDSVNFIDILEIANGILFYARKREEAILRNIFENTGQLGEKKKVAVLDAVAVQLARENPNLCRWVVIDVLFGDGTTDDKVFARKHVEDVIDKVAPLT